ncbi:MAG TPA: FAD-binding oxidoreductase [Nitrososphaerales archaeon]|nr:FAD-binding oxidoreductase [Nitrososphaerales archaeon]
MKKKTSIAIIGAGIIGASIAYNLAMKGERDVVVFDMGRAGGGSTAAALGGFRYQFSNELSVLLSKESVRVIDNFKDLTGYDPLVRHDGYSFIASQETSIRQLQKNMNLQKTLGVPVEFVSKEELQKRFPFYDFTGILGGTFCGADGHASTLAVHQGFVSKAKELGVEFYENCEVDEIKIESSVKGLIASNNIIQCAKVVIASGAYSGLVGKLARIEIPIEPVPRRVLVTRSFTNGIPLDIPLLIDVDSTLALGREGKGILIGDNQNISPGFKLEFPPDHDERLMSRAVEKVPALAEASISYANQGLYEMTPDANPIVSAIPEVEGLYCCAGFAGHGFMHSPAIGRTMAELLLEEKPHVDISSLDISRFKGHSLEKEKLII